MRPQIGALLALIGCAGSPEAAPPEAAPAPSSAASLGSVGSAVPERAAAEPPVPAEPPRVNLSALATPAGPEAAAALTGRWTLVAWIALGDAPQEVPASVRTALEPPQEAWEFAASGRVRHTLERLAMGGRWSVTGALPAPSQVAWLGVARWWLVALDGVTLSSVPAPARGREWALVARDGDELLVASLHGDPDLGPVTMAGRFAPAR